MFKMRVLAAALVAFALLASACGSDDDGEEATAPDAPAAAPDSDAEDTPAEAPAEPETEAAADSSDPIRIPLHNWSSQLVGAEVVGGILEEAGYSVEYVPSDSQVVYQSMCDGDIELVHEVWEGAFGVAFQEQVDKGCVLDWSTHNAVTREEWWYPSYVEEQCPGLPDWEALNACASIFATAETGDKGRFLGGPVDWLKGDEERVEGLGMDFEVVNAGSAATLWAELDAASVDNTPIVLFNWTPNFVEAVYEGNFIEFPLFEDACRTDPEWGINSELTHDCGNPADGYLKTGVGEHFPDKWPAAAAIVGRMDFTNPMLAAMAAAVDVDGKEPSEAAQEWLAANEDLWRGWISGEAAAAPAEAAADSSDPIRIPLHNWSSQLVGAEVVGGILEEAGYSVEYVPSDSQVVYQSMCDGDIELVHEVWEGAFGVAFQEQVDKGCVLDWSTHNAVTREEWWYPSYVEEQCPGLPDWEALNACASIFATAETGDKGRFLGGPVDWLKGDEERVEGLGMDFEVINAGSAATLWAELDAASVDNTPIVLFNWTPNFVEAVYEGNFIEFPLFEDACRTDPEWGINSELTHDCGNPADGYLKTGVGEHFPDKWPAAAAIVGRMDFTNPMLAAMAAAVDVDGKEPSEAAQEWLAANEDLWQGWLAG